MTETTSPVIVALAGPNGAGKSTIGPILLRGPLRVAEFVNADVIAQGLSAFAPDAVAIAAGRVMLHRIADLSRHRTSFAFETTLAGRAHARWAKGAISNGYEFHVVYLWLKDPDLAVERVAKRAQAGGHSVPEEVVRRRYRAGLRNLFALYRPLATTWRLYDNSGDSPRPIAYGRASRVTTIRDKHTWAQILSGVDA